MSLKNLVLLFVLFTYISGCKKKESDSDLNICGDVGYKHLQNGTCVCDNNWFGWNCDKSCDLCGPHGHCVENWCVCDSGWFGSDCNMSKDQISGLYHVMGRRSSWLGGQGSNTTPIDAVIEITMHGDTVFAEGYKHTYYGEDSLFCIFRWEGTNTIYGSISFQKNTDSAFYDQETVSPGGGQTTIWTGVKLR